MTRSALFVLLAVVVTPAAGARAQQAELPASLIALDSDEGRRLLVESSARDDFFALASHFTTQEYGSFCGAASAVVVLNALQVTAPPAPELRDVRVFTQDNLFTGAAARVMTAENVKRGGMTLEQLAALLQAHPARVRRVHASDSSVDQFRRVATETLKRPGDFVIVNYDRAGVGQETMGHISPIAAYHEGTDRFLLMDVARYKYPPVWARAEDLFAAMSTRDVVAGKSRGFLIVTRAARAAPVPAPAPGNAAMRFIATVVGGTFAGGAAIGAVIATLVTRRRWKKRLARARSAGV